MIPFKPIGLIFKYQYISYDNIYVYSVLFNNDLQILTKESIIPSFDNEKFVTIEIITDKLHQNI